MIVYFCSYPFPYQGDVFSYDTDYSYEYSLSLSMSLPEVPPPTSAPTRAIPKGPPMLLGRRKRFRNRNTNGRRQRK